MELHRTVSSRLRYRARAAVMMYTTRWWSCGATYPLGEIVADSEGVMVRIPWVKTVRIRRSELRALVLFQGWPGVLR